MTHSFIKKFSQLAFVAVLLVSSLSSCQKEDILETKDFQYEFNFESSTDGWTPDFTDYPVGEEKFYELGSKLSTLPAPLDQTKKGLMLTGTNRSDDLFMFIKKQLTGLKPRTTYSVTIEVQLASQYPENSVGIGGSPGSSVYLKAGMVTSEPRKFDSNNFYQINIDKGNQAAGGKGMMVLGHIGTTEKDFVYQLIKRDNNAAPYEAFTDEEGKIWVIVGTDSGFEGTTTLYYDAIRINFKEKI